MRTDKEIIDRIKAIEAGDVFGFEVAQLLFRLPFEAARPWLVEDATAEVWEFIPRDRESLIREMSEYFSFALEKARDERGLSANRSMCYYSAWVWLAGDDLGNLTSYTGYGADNLRKIGDHYGFQSADVSVTNYEE